MECTAERVSESGTGPRRVGPWIRGAAPAYSELEWLWPAGGDHTGAAEAGDADVAPAWEEQRGVSGAWAREPRARNGEKESVEHP